MQLSKIVPYCICNLKDMGYTFLKDFPGTIGYDLRYQYFKKRLAHCGKNVLIKPNVSLSIPDKISLEDYSNIGAGCYLFGDGGISIGKHSLLAMNVILMTYNHVISDTSIPISLQGSEAQKITIGDDCWLGANVIVLSGVSIGNGCVVGAGSVVTKNIPDYSVAVGNPARVIKSRNGITSFSSGSGP